MSQYTLSNRLLIDALASRYAKPNYTQTAKALGITKSYLSKLRSGNKPMTDSLRIRIEDLLKEQI